MPAPFFTTNPSDFTKLEGLYIFEKDPPGFIRGVNLNTVGVMGRTVRGPTGAITISSSDEFVDIYGGRDYGSGGSLVNLVWRFLLNKPFGTVVVSRAVAGDAVKASLSLEETVDGTDATAIVRVDASSVGIWGNDVAVRVEPATDEVSTHWNLRVTYLGADTLYENLNTQTASDDNVAEVVGDSNSRLIDITKLNNGRPANQVVDPNASPLVAVITNADWLTKDNTDFSMDLGTVLTDYDDVPGTNGTEDATDYTVDGPLDDMTNTKGISIVAYADDSTADIVTINDAIEVNAATSNDRIFLVWTGDHTDTVGTGLTTYMGTATRDDRIVHCYNSPYTVDPETSLQIQTPPTAWMASILSQNDVDIHPGEEATKTQTAGITKLTFPSLSRGNYITIRNLGVAALERDDGFLFVSGVTTDLTSGKTEITRRRSADFLQLSASTRLANFVKKKNTETNRALIKGELESFSQGLQDQERVVEAYVVDNESLNTDAARAQGIETVLWRVRLIGHMLHLVLQTEIGTGVTIEA